MEMLFISNCSYISYLWIRKVQTWLSRTKCTLLRLICDVCLNVWTIGETVYHVQQWRGLFSICSALISATLMFCIQLKATHTGRMYKHSCTHNRTCVDTSRQTIQRIHVSCIDQAICVAAQQLILPYQQFKAFHMGLMIYPQFNQLYQPIVHTMFAHFKLQREAFRKGNFCLQFIFAHFIASKKMFGH